MLYSECYLKLVINAANVQENGICVCGVFGSCCGGDCGGFIHLFNAHILKNSELTPLPITTYVIMMCEYSPYSLI